MTLLGVSGSDVKAAGWNAAVGIGVAASCYLVAALAKNLAERAFNHYYKTPTVEQKQRFDRYGSFAVFAAGVAAACAVSAYLPARFSFITNTLTSQIVKLGVLQSLFGLFIDSQIHGWSKSHKGTANSYLNWVFTGLGAAIPLATRFTKHPVAWIGTYGALVGAGYINFKP